MAWGFGHANQPVEQRGSARAYMHADQPDAQQVTVDCQRPIPAGSFDRVPFITSFGLTYQACDTVIKQTRLNSNPFANEWHGIIERRIQMLGIAKAKLLAALSDCDLWQVPIDVRDTAMQVQALDNRPRRLCNEALTQVAYSPGLILQPYQGRISYDQRITYVLRDTFDRFEAVLRGKRHQVEALVNKERAYRSYGR